ncbi:hypothetical protein BASA81_010033 [Batrachochytrium salamandrivorans]|nr:hypothetical protein BASA81_010033 [Batrachochytrium salamandrivorans]
MDCVPLNRQRSEKAFRNANLDFSSSDAIRSKCETELYEGLFAVYGIRAQNSFDACVLQSVLKHKRSP